MDFICKTRIWWLLYYVRKSSQSDWKVHVTLCLVSVTATQNRAAVMRFIALAIQEYASCKLKLWLFWTFKERCPFSYNKTASLADQMQLVRSEFKPEYTFLLNKNHSTVPSDIYIKTIKQLNTFYLSWNAYVDVCDIVALKGYSTFFGNTLILQLPQS